MGGEGFRRLEIAHQLFFSGELDTMACDLAEDTSHINHSSCSSVAYLLVQSGF